MSAARQLVESCFARLSERPGFVSRPNQLQVALLLADCIEGKSTACIEAPTGLGKSLAALIPALAYGAVDGKRIVIATYTNVLAEQYWQHDLPLAQELLQLPTSARTAFLIGRQRYACRAAMNNPDEAPDEFARARIKVKASDIIRFKASAELGTESEFRRFVRGSGSEVGRLWRDVAVPQVCPSKACPYFGDCYYFQARRRCESANVIITNHSVVIQDAILKSSSEEGQGMLGAYDFLIVDEAHDFLQAALNGLEFEVGPQKLDGIASMAQRFEIQFAGLAARAERLEPWSKAFKEYRQSLTRVGRSLGQLPVTQTAILSAAPSEVWEHPQVQQRHATGTLTMARDVATDIGEVNSAFYKALRQEVQAWKASGTITDSEFQEGREGLQNLMMVVSETAAGCTKMFDLEGAHITHLKKEDDGAALRTDPLDVSQPLREMLWDRGPWACLSATLALDSSFDFFSRSVGAVANFQEILPSPFDFRHQAALYLPPTGAIPDPTVARREGIEDEYFYAIARQLDQIIAAMRGRTLALFHSRREMEAVFERLRLDREQFPVLVQSKYGSAAIGRAFREKPEASLFALRSFWTGFDAPGETLSCVVLVRVPFEVPIEPSAIGRVAYLQTQQRDAFREHTLPIAKMLMRQGAGRLIRRETDKGLIVLLDARLRAKAYGEEILANMPSECRVFSDLMDAVAWVDL